MHNTPSYCHNVVIKNVVFSIQKNAETFFPVDIFPVDVFGQTFRFGAKSLEENKIQAKKMVIKYED